MDLLVDIISISIMKNKEIEALFPNLKDSNYKIISPRDIDYNCIAWAAGDCETLWWPDPLNIGYWPDEVPRAESLEAFIKAFEILGYNVCDNTGYEEGFEKIAIFTGESGKPTHAARQLNFGIWTSKLGKLYDIEHEVEGVTGLEYGHIAVCMKRSKQLRGTSGT